MSQVVDGALERMRVFVEIWASVNKNGCLCILIVIYVFLDVATMNEGFPCFFLSCKANARVQLAKTGHGPQSSKIVVLFYVLFLCKCVLYYCHRATTQLQLKNIFKKMTDLKVRTRFSCFTNGSIILSTEQEVKLWVSRRMIFKISKNHAVIFK